MWRIVKRRPAIVSATTKTATTTTGGASEEREIEANTDRKTVSWWHAAGDAREATTRMGLLGRRMCMSGPANLGRRKAVEVGGRKSEGGREGGGQESVGGGRWAELGCMKILRLRSVAATSNSSSSSAL